MDLQDPWDFEEVYGALHDFARAYPFDPEAEDYLVNITTGTHVAQICWFLLTEARYIPAKFCSSPRPSAGRTAAPAATASSTSTCRATTASPRASRPSRREDASFLKSGIATRNEAFNRMIDRIEQVAIRSKAPLLLTGPTGAGKSQLARRIYELKKMRRQVEGAFVEVNCATLRGDDAMSALFGHRKGAFTGAVQDRPGLLRAADGGMLFLDEIGELGLDEQAMILRAIEDKRFLPVGADQEVASDFQLIAGTNRDLAEAIGKGALPRRPLRPAQPLDLRAARPEGAPRGHRAQPRLRAEALRRARRLAGRPSTARRASATSPSPSRPRRTWSANFRDLGASITRMATLAPAGRITEDVVEEEIERLQALWRRPGGAPADDPLTSLLGAGRLSPNSICSTASSSPRWCASAAATVSLSAAGRALFAASRGQKASVNDADRLRKYLARFGLEWKSLT